MQNYAEQNNFNFKNGELLCFAHKVIIRLKFLHKKLTVLTVKFQILIKGGWDSAFCDWWWKA